MLLSRVTAVLLAFRYQFVYTVCHAGSRLFPTVEPKKRISTNLLPYLSIPSPKESMFANPDPTFVTIFSENCNYNSPSFEYITIFFQLIQPVNRFHERTDLK